MNAVSIYAEATIIQRAQTTNATDASYAARLATATRPAASATRSVFDKGLFPNRPTIEVWPFGGNDNNDVINLLLYGWNQTLSGLYVKTSICEVQATLSSTLVGIAAHTVVATEFFADTLTLTSGAAMLRNGIGDQDEASFIADASGFELVEIIYKKGSGADGMNALVRFM